MRRLIVVLLLFLGIGAFIFGLSVHYSYAENNDEKNPVTEKHQEHSGYVLEETNAPVNDGYNITDESYKDKELEDVLMKIKEDTDEKVN